MRMYWEVVDIAWVGLEEAIGRPHIVNITSFMVDNNYQGLGIGSALLRAICQDADAQGIELWCVPQSIDRRQRDLIRFYNEQGFLFHYGAGSGYMIRKPQKTPT